MFGVTRRQLGYWVKIGLVRGTRMPHSSHLRYTNREVVIVGAISGLLGLGQSTYAMRSLIGEFRDLLDDMGTRQLRSSNVIISPLAIFVTQHATDLVGASRVLAVDELLGANGQ